MDLSAHFKEKKITVMGLGLLGRGVGDIRYLASCGADLIVTDLKDREALASSLDELKEFSNITYVLGEHRLEDFRDRDLILKAAGVPLDSIYIEEARKHHILVAMSAALFAKLSGLPVVGVTGTRGKSTVTHMIEEGMKAAGKKVLVGGNVRGVSNLALIPEATPEHTLVMELDSWQLQGFGEERISPHVSVFTTFFPDHLNYYKGDQEAYLADKALIFLHQKPEDTLVLGTQAHDSVFGSYEGKIPSRVVEANSETLPNEWKLSVPGEHNRYNAGLALAALRTLSIPDEISKAALEKFNGVPGRLELVRKVNGVKIYNDTNSTTPEAALVALRALDPNNKKSLILIMGGADKNLDMNELLYAIPQHVKRLILLSGTGTSRIAPMLTDASIFDSLSAAVTEAMHGALSGDIILFSPAFASFGMFKNEYDRGDQFNALVKAL